MRGESVGMSGTYGEAAVARQLGDTPAPPGSWYGFNSGNTRPLGRQQAGAVPVPRDSVQCQFELLATGHASATSRRKPALPTTLGLITQRESNRTMKFRRRLHALPSLTNLHLARYGQLSRTLPHIRHEGSPCIRRQHTCDFRRADRCAEGTSTQQLVDGVSNPA